MDRHTRYWGLRGIYARVKALFGAQSTAAQHEARHRAMVWQRQQVAGRLLHDGVVRSPQDPDAQAPPQDQARQWAERQAQVEQARQWQEATGRQ